MRWPLPTLRFLGLLCLGLLLIIAGRWLGRPEPAGIGAALACLPLLTWILACLWPSLARPDDAAPTRLIRGLGNRLPTPGETLTVSLDFPDVAGQGKETLPPGAHLLDGKTDATTYTWTPAQRGHHLLGPWTSRGFDPLHLVRLTTQTDQGTPVVVGPSPAPDAGEGAGTTGHKSALSRGGDQLDTTTRPYRAGDPFRRIHWPVSARQGKIMVRPQIQETERSATVLLDRNHAHYDGERTWVANAPGPDLASTSTFDAAVATALEAYQSLSSTQSGTGETHKPHLTCFPDDSTQAPNASHTIPTLLACTVPADPTGHATQPPHGRTSRTIIVTGTPGPDAAQWPQACTGPVLVLLHPNSPDHLPTAEVLDAWEHAGWTWRAQP